MKLNEQMYPRSGKRVPIKWLSQVPLKLKRYSALVSISFPMCLDVVLPGRYGAAGG
ncbi:MAG: hypothetical protein ACI8T1_004680, partial [Verrucomicrobiales bacterium]